MRTDKQLYTLLQTVPSLFTDLTGIPLSPDYVFAAVTLKALERDLDGLLFPSQPPTDSAYTVYVVEFQAYYDKLIYPRLLQEACTYQLQQADKPLEVEAILIFLNATYDPKQAPWHELGRSGKPGLRVFYLDEMIATLPAGHFLKALFLPLLEEDAEYVRQHAQAAHQQLWATTDLQAAQKENLMAIFQSWLTQRFANLSKEEIQTMLRLPEVPLEQTRFYREVRQLGLKEGIKRGIEKGELNLLVRLLRKRFGELPPWVEQKLNHADTVSLEEWGERVLDAESLEAVFKTANL
jgi:predicted transposase/invertase (TIGR01784 family)